MASTHCFYLHHHGLSAPARPSSSHRYVPVLKPNQLVCRAQKQSASAHEDDGASSVAVSRRLALTVLIGAAAVGSKVSPADAAYGEAGTCFSPHSLIVYLLFNHCTVSGSDFDCSL